MAVKEQVSYRQRQAQATREAIARAARELFRERGYVGTTIQAISEAAEIPAPTIYSALGNKPRILEEIRRLWIAESSVQDLHDQAMATPDPAARLRLAARWTRRQLELGSDVITIYQEAARADPRMAEVWRTVLAGRERAVRRLIVSLERRLAPGVTVARAVDVFLTCTLSEVYRCLVVERGWSPDSYQTWLADLLTHQLLGPTDGGGGRSAPDRETDMTEG